MAAFMLEVKNWSKSTRLLKMASKVVLRPCSEEISLEAPSKTSIRDKIWRTLTSRSKE